MEPSSSTAADLPLLHDDLVISEDNLRAYIAEIRSGGLKLFYADPRLTYPKSSLRGGVTRMRAVARRRRSNPSFLKFAAKDGLLRCARNDDKVRRRVKNLRVGMTYPIALLIASIIPCCARPIEDEVP